MLVSCLQNIINRHFDPEVEDLIAVVRHDDIDEILADVVDITLHCGQHDLALIGAHIRLRHERFQIVHRCFHGFRRLEHEGQLHLSGAKEIPHHPHAIKQNGIDDLEWPARFHGVFQEFVQPLFVPVDYPVFELLFRSLRFFAFFPGGDFRRLSIVRHEFGQGIKAWSAQIEHQLTSQIAPFGVDLVEWKNLLGVHNRCVEAGLDSVVQKHRVQNLADLRR